MSPLDRERNPAAGAAEAVPLQPSGICVSAPAPNTPFPSGSAIRAWVDAARIVVLRAFANDAPEVVTRAMTELSESAGTGAPPRVFDVFEAPAGSGPASVIRGCGRVPFHWDTEGDLASAGPAYVAYHCVRAPAAGAGGETLFCRRGKGLTEDREWALC
jgi:hypothetical protein